MHLLSTEWNLDRLSGHRLDIVHTKMRSLKIHTLCPSPTGVQGTWKGGNLSLGPSWEEK